MATLLEKAAPNITETASALQLHPDRGHKKQDAKRRNSHVPHSHIHSEAKSDNTNVFRSSSDIRVKRIQATQ
jgi:hypothetical protein